MTIELEHRCWSCQKINNRATSAEMREEGRKPNQGDITFCIGCGEWGIFDKYLKGGIRRPTFDEYAEIVGNNECTKLREAWLIIIDKPRKRKEGK